MTGEGGESAGAAGLAGFSSHLHRQHAQEPQGALQAGRLRPCAEGSSQRLPLDTASDWTIVQSLRVETLRHTMALKSGKCRTWKMAVDQLTKNAGDMSVLVRNLKEQERRVSPTAHAPVLLMPTQKFMHAMLEIENAFEPSGPSTMRSAQFLGIFVENGINDESITEALDVYESFHVLEALPTRWSPIPLFKWICRMCFTHAS